LSASPEKAPTSPDPYRALLSGSDTKISAQPRLPRDTAPRQRRRRPIEPGAEHRGDQLALPSVLPATGMRCAARAVRIRRP